MLCAAKCRFLPLDLPVIANALTSALTSRESIISQLYSIALNAVNIAYDAVDIHQKVCTHSQ